MWNVSQRELENLWNQVEKEKEKKKVENERAGERKEWELLESNGSKEEKKRRGCTNMGIRVWLTKCKRKKKEKKKGNVWMKEKAKNKKSQFKNNTIIFSQYFHNKF